MFKHILVLIVLTSLVNSEYVDYKNHKVYKVTPQTEKEVKILVDLVKTYEYLFWNDYEYIKVGREVKIQVPPGKQEHFEKRFTDLGIEATRAIDDVQKIIDMQSARSATTNRNVRDYTWDHYQTLDEIYAWMEATVAAFPDVASLVTLGYTHEGRPIMGVKIDHSGLEHPQIGFIEGGLHAREWISPATATWIINEFLTSTDPAVRSMAEDVVWHIFPVTNPDGYVYSFTDNRMWRKNRNPTNATSCAHLGISDDFSVGIDLNRNFDFNWNVFEDNSDPCTIVYAGPSAFSENESIGIANYIHRLNEEESLIYYLSYHSFTELLLLPHSHTGVTGGENVITVTDYANMFEIGARGMERLKAVHNVTYAVGTVPDLFPGALTGGLGFDWAKGVAHIPMSFLFELRDSGEYGFLLPPHNIVPNNEEVIAGMAEMHVHVKRLGYLMSSAYTFGSCAIVLIASIFAIASLS